MRIGNVAYVDIGGGGWGVGWGGSFALFGGGGGGRCCVGGGEVWGQDVVCVW